MEQITSVNRRIFIKICKHEIIINLIKINVLNNDFSRIDAIKIIINESIIGNNPESYEKLKFLSETDKQLDILKLINICYQNGNTKVKPIKLKSRDLLIKELHALRTDKPGIYFYNLVENNNIVFDKLFNTLTNDTLGGK